ncbi:hypothetical protein BDY19DRAFT_990787 [Irpex rosettiformis]|uniref:Uncharacterized protein n=1 Tax=Irpex rosettiformis TaxID=378272 RepID=A0ACB8UCU5_9APHY|nr:hypothetical protein BDY19DRAFT_990787 [Irpex rosettiformis]
MVQPNEIPPQHDLDDDDDEMHPAELADPDADDEFDEWERELTHRGGKDGRTDSCKSFLEKLSLAEVATRVEQAFVKLLELKLDVTNLLYYITRLQGTKEDTAKIKYARTALLQSDEFPLLVRKWRQGRARVHNKGYSTRGARDALDEWSLENVNMLINQEMRALGPVMKAPVNDLTEEKLLNINLEQLETTVQEKAPTLWNILHHASTTPTQSKTLSYKTHAAPIIMMIGTCSYRRSQHRCLLQQLNSVYFKACGLSARAYDTTHMYGITMSHSWVYHLIDKLSEDAKQQLLADIRRYPFRISHDNLNLGFKVYEQHRNKQTRFDSGTAATAYIIKDEGIVWPDREAYQTHRAAAFSNTITARDIWDLEIAAAPRLRERAIYRVIKFLMDTTSFDFETYEFKDSDIFSPPPPRDQLPIDSAHTVAQYMLDTVAIESASQEGTRKCLDEWMRQLGLDGPEDTLKHEPILQKLLVVLGDQLTTVRLRSIKKDRSEDFNFIQRYDHIVEHPGWFHTQLSDETSIHKQYYTTHKPFGLQHGFELLKRKGLHATSVKGVFHHGMQEALLHMATAHFRDLWIVVAKVKDISDLRRLSPERLRAIATTIVDEHASTSALVKNQQMPADDQDKVFIHGVQFCRDVLNYLELDDAMKTGDVGRMEDLLPRLLFRFNGGGSSNYAIEILELLQGLQREWTPELR